MRNNIRKRIFRAVMCAVLILAIILCTACGMENIGKFTETVANNSVSIGEGNEIHPGSGGGRENDTDSGDITQSEYFFEVDEEETDFDIEIGTVAQSEKKYTAKQKSEDETSGSSPEESSSGEQTSSSSQQTETTAPSSGTSAESTTVPETTVPPTTTRPKTTVTTTTWNYSTTAPAPVPAGTFDGKFYYRQLNSDQKEIYEAAYAAVKSGSAEFGYIAESGYNKSDLSKGVTAFRNDHPEYCSLNGGYLSTMKGTDITVTLKTRNFCDDPSGGSYRSELMSKASQIVSQARRYSPGYEQIKFVHDYLCKTVEYDFSSASKSSSDQSPAEQMSNTAYGALINGKAVCGGISFAFELIMQQLGYECGYVSGRAKRDSHAWNIIKVGSNYYYVDVTFDDHYEKGKDYIEYNYFCVTASEISKTHTASGDFTYPYAESNDLNFYYTNGYVIYSFYTESDYGIIEEQMGNDYIHIKFTSETAYRQARSSDSQLLADIRKATGQKSITYYHDDDYLVLAFST